MLNPFRMWPLITARELSVGLPFVFTMLSLFLLLKMPGRCSCWVWSWHFRGSGPILRCV
jgi:hypothetical protein